MNIEAPQVKTFHDTHIDQCKKVLAKEMLIGTVVEELRSAVEGKDRTLQTEAVKGIANVERHVFKARAAEAIDRHLDPSDEGVKASALEINKGLLNFVSLVTPNIRLRARAGSGKSTALVIKCDFLINELNVPPEAIQLLTFNRSASDELSKKLCKALGDEVGKKVGVNTFHSLAYRVLKCCPQTQHMMLSFNDEDRSQKEQLSDLNKTVIEETTPHDFAAYRDRYDGTSFSYITRLDGFNQSIQDFITRATALYRARRGAPTPLKHNPITRHLERLVAAYELRLEQTNTLDGEAGLREAGRILVRDAEFSDFDRLNGGLQFLFVDEFQDFSAAFAEITQGVMARNPNCVMNAVGDDWQSINAFMGADLSFFNGMKKSYAATLNLPLQSNWRCGKRIVELGNKVMGATKMRAAVPALPHEGKIRVHVGGIQNYRRKKEEWHAEAQDYLGHHINRMAQAAWADDARAKRKPGKVALLAAQNCPFSQRLSSYAKMVDNSEGGAVTWSTSHASKGGEWDHVILLDGIASHYPSDHPAEPAQSDMIKRSALEEEGQRLLYVAVTRAKYSLAILAPTELHPRLSAAVPLSKL
jgi:DNA helicase-4